MIYNGGLVIIFGVARVVGLPRGTDLLYQAMESPGTGARLPEMGPKENLKRT